MSTLCPQPPRRLLVLIKMHLQQRRKSRNNLRENAQAVRACINGLLFSHMHLFCFDRRLPYLSKATSPSLGNTGLLLCKL
jgi:hypothetical protein